MIAFIYVIIWSGVLFIIICTINLIIMSINCILDTKRSKGVGHL